MNHQPSFCPQCGASLETDDRFCGACGTTVQSVAPDDNLDPTHPPNREANLAPPPPEPEVASQQQPDGNTSGQGESSQVPVEIKKWNWGAFFMTWIWGIGNQTYIALLGLIPLVNIVMMFILGAKGNQWAWQNKRWDSIEHFKRVQRRWSQVALGLILLWLIITIAVAVLS